MTGAIGLFFFVIMIYVVIADVITILLRLTGMTEEKAKFQVMSLLTNSGFTTAESESIMQSQIRRRIARATMVFGYCFSVSIISVIVNLFLSMGKEAVLASTILMIFVGSIFIAVMVLRKIGFIKSFFDQQIEKLAMHFLFSDRKNPVVILDDYGEAVVAQVILNGIPAFLANKELKDSGLKESFGILAMMVKQADGHVAYAQAETVLHPGEVLIVMGKSKDIKKAFSQC